MYFSARASSPPRCVRVYIHYINIPSPSSRNNIQYCGGRGHSKNVDFAFLIGGGAFDLPRPAVPSHNNNFVPTTLGGTVSKFAYFMVLDLHNYNSRRCSTQLLHTFFFWKLNSPKSRYGPHLRFVVRPFSILILLLRPFPRRIPRKVLTLN
jgi:hypothetical protein